MDDLRKKLTKLAYANPDLREHLLPLLKEGSVSKTAGVSYDPKRLGLVIDAFVEYLVGDPMAAVAKFRMLRRSGVRVPTPLSAGSGLYEDLKSTLFMRIRMALSKAGASEVSDVGEDFGPTPF